jgi:hypothetical protein
MSVERDDMGHELERDGFYTVPTPPREERLCPRCHGEVYGDFIDNECPDCHDEGK